VVSNQWSVGNFSGYRLPIADNRLLITDYRLLITDYLYPLKLTEMTQLPSGLIQFVAAQAAQAEGQPFGLAIDLQHAGDDNLPFLHDVAGV
jgi:hypothetical protein